MQIWGKEEEVTGKMLGGILEEKYKGEGYGIYKRSRRKTKWDFKN